MGLFGWVLSSRMFPPRGAASVPAHGSLRGGVTVPFSLVPVSVGAGIKVTARISRGTLGFAPVGEGSGHLVKAGAEVPLMAGTAPSLREAGLRGQARVSWGSPGIILGSGGRALGVGVGAPTG